MGRSNLVKQKKRGAQPTGVNSIMAFRPPLRFAIEAYAMTREISLSEAIRRLVELGLRAKSEPPHRD